MAIIVISNTEIYAAEVITVATAETFCQSSRTNAALLPSLAKDCLGFECILPAGTTMFISQSQKEEVF